MEINITAGECLNETLSNRYKDKIFIPFNEAMIKGTYSSKLFSKEFILERIKTHNTTLDDYMEKLGPFINFLKDVNKAKRVILWFGDEDFCRANRQVVIQTLIEYEFTGEIQLNIVEEPSGKIIRKETIQ